MKPTPSQNREIIVRGAREHNLKGIDVKLPRDSLIVMTGLSGSGKSSLAFDTIYAEGQRRYVESLSAYARQFLEMMQKPDVEHIEGLSPAISIEQKTTSRNPRSTVGTVTEIYDYLRLLFARVGIPYSPATGLPIESQTVSQMVDRTLELPEGTRLYLLAPIARGRKGEFKKELADLMRKGFQRVKIDGEYHEIEDAPALDKKFKHDIEVVVDRVVVSPDISGRLAESFETALKLADGIALVEYADDKNEDGSARQITFSEKFACPVSGFTIAEIEPRLFSFNNPFGACPVCDGLGTEQKIDPDQIVPDATLSLRDGAILPWSKTSAPYYQQTLQAVVKHYGASTGTAWNELPFDVQHAVLFGTDKTSIDFVYDDGLRQYKTSKPFEGVIGNLERRYKETESAGMREEIEKYMSAKPCVACGGYRLKPETLAVKIDGLHIGKVSDMSIKVASKWFVDLSDKLTPTQSQIGERILKEIRERLNFLNDVAQFRHPVGRRKPAHSSRQPDRLGPDRRSLCARRALHRSPPARQCPSPRNAAAPA
jgi:excinuclease ABC subunit A